MGMGRLGFLFFAILFLLVGGWIAVGTAAGPTLPGVHDKDTPIVAAAPSPRS